MARAIRPLPSSKGWIRRIFSPRRPVFAFLGRLGKYDPLRYFELHGSCDRSAAILLATHHETASELTLNSQKTGYFGDRIQSLSVGLDLCLSPRCEHHLP
jgi:hypothetical protein